MIVAAVDWGAVGTIAAVVVSALTAVLVYLRGRKGDDALALSTRTAADNELTKANVLAQGGIIDQLQEEVARYRVDLRETHAELEAVRQTARDLRHELVNAQAERDAAKIVIDALDKKLEALQTLVTTHEMTIARLEALLTSASKDRP